VEATSWKCASARANAEAACGTYRVLDLAPDANPANKTILQESVAGADRFGIGVVARRCRRKKHRTGKHGRKVVLNRHLAKRYAAERW
jgi:hypothetical protein